MWPFTRKQQQPPQQQARGTLWPVSLWRPRGDHSLEGSEAIFGAVTLLSNTIASMHLRLMQGYREAEDHPLARLIGYQPNPRQDPFMFWQTIETCRDVYGNCYAFKVPGAGGETVALDILDPQQVHPLRDAASGDIWYQITPREGGTLYVSGREMIHCRHVGAGDRGVNPLTVLEDSLAYDDQMKSFSLEQVRGINGAVVLDFPTTMGKEQAQKYIDDFREQYNRSNGSIILLSGGVKSSTINRSPVDAKVLDVDRITANKVARVYNIPPSLLGDYSSSSYASQEQQQMEYLERTIIPICRMYEAQLNLKLLTWEQRRQGYRFSFDVSDLVVADQASRAQVYQYMIRSGIMTQNEARRRPVHGHGAVHGAAAAPGRDPVRSDPRLFGGHPGPGGLRQGTAVPIPRRYAAVSQPRRDRGWRPPGHGAGAAHAGNAQGCGGGGLCREQRHGCGRHFRADGRGDHVHGPGGGRRRVGGRVAACKRHHGRHQSPGAAGRARCQPGSHAKEFPGRA